MDPDPISVWNDIRFTAEERSLKHPAMIPTMLVERIIGKFTRDSQPRILDPFMGSGSTLLAARNLGRTGIGFDVPPSAYKADAPPRRGPFSRFGRTLDLEVVSVREHGESDRHMQETVQRDHRY